MPEFILDKGDERRLSALTSEMQAYNRAVARGDSADFDAATGDYLA